MDHSRGLVMPLTPSRPYFSSLHQHSPRPPEREVGALARGEIMTREGIIRQAGFMAEYTHQPQRQAAWLVGLAACTGNDAATPFLMDQALAMGLAVEDAAHLAVFSDSRVAAKHLTTRGVDWADQMIVPHQGKSGAPSPRIDAPVEVFMEHAIDPARAAQRYDTSIRLVSALDVGLSLASIHPGRTSGFLQGVIETGVDPQSRVVSDALGLASGTVSVLSLLIANCSWGLARQCMQSPLSPATRDEALLACAMLHQHLEENHREDRMEWEFVVGQLRLQGANVDAVFEFRNDVAERLHGYVGPRDSRRYGTARQWFLDGVLCQPVLDSGKWQPWFCPLPLPDSASQAHPPAHEYWCEWFNHAWFRNPNATSENPSASRLMGQLLDADAVDPSRARDVLDLAVETCAADCPALFDALLSTPGLDLVGNFSRSQFTELLRAALGAIDGEPWAETLNEDAIERIWRHPRLNAMTALLNAEDAQLFTQQVAPFLAMLDKLWPAQAPIEDLMATRPPKSTRTSEEDQALALSLDAAMCGFEQGVAPSNRPRRSL